MVASVADAADLFYSLLFFFFVQKPAEKVLIRRDLRFISTIVLCKAKTESGFVEILKKCADCWQEEKERKKAL